VLVKPFLCQTKKADWEFIIPASLIFFPALLVTLWDFTKVQEMTYRLGLVNVVGLGLGLTGVSIRRVAEGTLRKYHSYVLRTTKKHGLIKQGICKHIRYPAYLGMLLYCMGIPMFFSSLYGFFLMLGFIPFILYRIKIEENILLEKFGDEYRQYMKETKKIIPFIY